MKEPDYLQNEQIRVLDPATSTATSSIRSRSTGSQAEAQKLKFRQDPGPQNALGLVRIDMQNEHGVYMHDTPMKPLFQQRSRPFSAGCVRVQDVFQLVDGSRATSRAGASRAARSRLEQGQALDVNLTRPVPVYFTYITAWAERDGEVEFRPDIYKRDGAVDQVAEMDRDPKRAASADHAGALSGLRARRTSWALRGALRGRTGSAGRIRTYDRPINSRMLYH